MMLEARVHRFRALFFKMIWGCVGALFFSFSSYAESRSKQTVVI